MSPPAVGFIRGSSEGENNFYFFITKKKRRQERLNSLHAQLRELQKDHRTRPETNKEVSVRKLQNEIDEIDSQEVKKTLVFL